MRASARRTLPRQRSPTKVLRPTAKKEIQRKETFQTLQTTATQGPPRQLPSSTWSTVIGPIPVTWVLTSMTLLVKTAKRKSSHRTALPWRWMKRSAAYLPLILLALVPRARPGQGRPAARRPEYRIGAPSQKVRVSCGC